MSFNMTDLPREILDMIFKNLVPTMDGWRYVVCPVDVFKELDAPQDLVNVMAVCKLFHELALPCAWRTAAISLTGDTTNTLSDDLQGSLLDWGQWEYLCKNPHLACHIRILALEIFGDDHHSSDIHALRSVVDLMSNLRVLRLVYNSKNEAVASVCTSLIEKPKLHTIVTSNTFPPELPSLPRNNLTHLNIKEWYPIYERFIQTSPCLQSLAFSESSEHHAGFVSTLEKLRIPWGTLRMLALKWMKDWPPVLNNLSSWKMSHPDTPAPLSELIIDPIHYNETSVEDIQHLANCGQDLRALWVGLPGVVEEATLKIIFDAFPRLEELGLLTHCRSKLWGINLPTVVRCLGNLSNLRSLHWNYLDEELDEDVDLDYESDVDDYENAMLDIFRRIVSAVAPQCRALEKITFNDEGMGEPEDQREDRVFFHLFKILRDGQGRYRDYRELNFRLVHFSLDKGDWDFCSFDYVF